MTAGAAPPSAVFARRPAQEVVLPTTRDRIGRARPALAGGRLPRTRAALRRRPRLQGMALAPSGVLRAYPEQTPALYFPFYHGVPAHHTAGFRRHLEVLLVRGRFITWSDALEQLASPTELAGPQFCLSFDDGHRDWLEQVVPVLQELNVPATFFITTGEVGPWSGGDAMTWHQVSELVAAGMPVGSHSVTHPRMSLLDDAASRDEVTRSKEVLEDRTGTPVLDFAAPYGLPGIDYGQREVDLVRAAGYRSLASARPGRTGPGGSPYAIPRSGLSPAWPLAALRRRVHE